MNIFFVRHGHPDYKNDCLTVLGHKQAEAVSKRLLNCNITRIFSSTNGRALQTAEYTAKLLSLPIHSRDFMREIDWGSLDGEAIPAGGHPWELADLYAAEGECLHTQNWQTTQAYCNNRAVSHVQTVTEGLDAWLATLGYQREGDYYRVMHGNTDQNVVMFGHGGSFSAALSHLFNIPFPQICGAFHMRLTSITVVRLSDEVGARVYPKLSVFNDATHIDCLDVENVYGK